MLAPAARVDRSTCQYLHDAAVNEELIKLMTMHGPEVFPSPNVDGHVTSALFKLTGVANFGVGMLTDDAPDKISQSGMETFMGHMPAGTSYKCLDHWRQLILTDTFRKYDNGLDKNLEVYGRSTPPIFNLQAFDNLPIAMFCGMSDKVASRLDYEWLRNELAVNKNCIYYKEYDIGHAAFLMPNE